MGRSPGFGSIAYDLTPSSDSVSLRLRTLSVLNLAIYNNSPDRSTKSTLSSYSALQLLVNIGFQSLFHSPPGVLFTFPSRYFFSIGHRLVFSLGRWSSLLPTRFLVPRGTLDSDSGSLAFAYGTFTLSGPSFPSIHSASSSRSFSSVLYPALSLNSSVWALPLSLATTHRITFVFSS
jgi:hypothetical protein